MLTFSSLQSCEPQRNPRATHPLPRAASSDPCHPSNVAGFCLDPRRPSCPSSARAPAPITAPHPISRALFGPDPRATDPVPQALDSDPRAPSPIRMPPIRCCGPPAPIRMPPIRPGAFPFFQQRTQTLLFGGKQQKPYGSMRSLILITISYIVLYKILIKNLLKVTKPSRSMRSLILITIPYVIFIYNPCYQPVKNKKPFEIKEIPFFLIMMRVILGS